MKAMHFLRISKSMNLRILAVSFLSAIPFYSSAHDERAVENTTIEYYEIELSQDDRQKLSHLTIHTENEYHTDEQDSEFPLPAQPQGDTGTSYANSRIFF
ncbi:hypothetical protein ABIA48_000066 [Pseudomonas sp. S30_BP2TU TE3576]